MYNYCIYISLIYWSYLEIKYFLFVWALQRESMNRPYNAIQKRRLNFFDVFIKEHKHFFIKYDYILIKLRNIILEMIKYIMFIFNSYLVITAQNWHIHFFFVNFVNTSRTNTYNKYQKKNGTLSAPKNLAVSREI